MATVQGEKVSEVEIMASLLMRKEKWPKLLQLLSDLQNF